MTISGMKFPFTVTLAIFEKHEIILFLFLLIGVDDVYLS